MSTIIKIINLIESKIKFSKFCSNGTTTFNILDNITELRMTKYIIGEIFSSGRTTLYKNPSDQTVRCSQPSNPLEIFQIIIIFRNVAQNPIPVPSFSLSLSLLLPLSEIEDLADDDFPSINSVLDRLRIFPRSGDSIEDWLEVMDDFGCNL